MISEPYEQCISFIMMCFIYFFIKRRLQGVYYINFARIMSFDNKVKVSKLLEIQITMLVKYSTFISHLT